MTLLEAISQSDSMGDDVVIYAREPWTRDSECMLLKMDSESAEVSDDDDVKANGFAYFLEVSIIHEVFDGWTVDVGRAPTPGELCDRVIHYAIHDA